MGCLHNSLSCKSFFLRTFLGLLAGEKIPAQWLSTLRYLLLVLGNTLVMVNFSKIRTEALYIITQLRHSFSFKYSSVYWAKFRKIKWLGQQPQDRVPGIKGLYPIDQSLLQHLKVRIYSSSTTHCK